MCFGRNLLQIFNGGGGRVAICGKLEMFFFSGKIFTISTEETFRVIFFGDNLCS